MIKYQIKKEHLFHNDIGNYVAYGITVNSIKDTEIAEIMYVSDVFLDYEKACEFVQLCNKYELDPVHLNEVIEDFIG